MNKEPTFMTTSYSIIYFVVGEGGDILAIHTSLQSADKHCDELKAYEPECYVYSLEIGDYV